MKIAVLTGSTSIQFATAVILKLKQRGYKVNLIILKKSSLIKRITELINKYGLKNLMFLTFKSLFPRTFSTAESNSSLLCDYIANLGYRSDINLKSIIKKDKIPCIFFKKYSDKKFLSSIRSEGLDIIIHAFGVGIIKGDIFKFTKIGILNAHMGLLPKYRGMNVLEWALFNDDQVGITIHLINSGIDMGDILVRKTLQVEKGDSIQKLREKSFPISVDAISETVEKLTGGAIQVIRQKEQDGKQYYVMHDRLKIIINRRLLNIASYKHYDL